MNRVQLSAEYFPNPVASKALSNANIYVGLPDTDPEVVANRKTISALQENGSIVAITQPVKTGLGGIPVYNGSPVTLLVDGRYSVKVTSSTGTQLYYVPANYQSDDSPVVKLSDIASLRTTQSEAGDGETIYLVCHTTNGDGGQGTFRWDATSTAADDNGVTIAVTGVAVGRRVRQLSGFVTPEMFGGLSALAAYAPLSVILDSKVYALLNDITFPDPISKFIGQGYGRLGGVFDGSVITGEGGVIFAATAPQQGLSLADFAIVYTGVWTALKISNFINSQIKNVYLDLQGVGDTGLDYSGDNTYFSLLENCTITSFKGTGVKINSTGTKHVVRDCNIGSAQETTVAAVEINVPGVSIYDGQVNNNKTDGSGIGILFNNLSTTFDHQGGLVQGTLSEYDIGVKITGNTKRWYDVQIRNTRYTMGNTSKAVVFDMAVGCVLDHPSIYSPSVNYIAEFTANAIKCGVVGDLETCRAAMIVNAGATNCYKRCDTPISYTERELITTYANLTTIVDDCQYLGKTIHNGRSWDKFSVSIPDDSFATFTPPELSGTMEISSTTVVGVYILANYDLYFGACSQIAVAASSAVNASNGMMTGTTGVDGKVTVRCSANGKVYVENRSGVSHRIIIHFKSPGPNT